MTPPDSGEREVCGAHGEPDCLKCRFPDAAVIPLSLVHRVLEILELEAAPTHVRLRTLASELRAIVERKPRSLEAHANGHARPLRCDMSDAQEKVEAESIPE